MENENSSRKSIFECKGVMHEDNIYLDTKAYNEFIKRQSYVNKTHPHPPLVIPEPTPSTQWKANFKIDSIMIPLILKFSMMVVMKTLKRSTKI